MTDVHRCLTSSLFPQRQIRCVLDLLSWLHTVYWRLFMAISPFASEDFAISPQRFWGQIESSFRSYPERDRVLPKKGIPDHGGALLYCYLLFYVALNLHQDTCLLSRESLL